MENTLRCFLGSNLGGSTTHSLGMRFTSKQIRVFGVMVLQRHKSRITLFSLLRTESFLSLASIKHFAANQLFATWGRSTRVDNNNVRLYYDVRGSGPVVVLPQVGAFLTPSRDAEIS